MAVEILSLLSDSENVEDHESSTAVFRTHVPWVGPSAYLHIVFKPTAVRVLSDAALKLNMPEFLVEFLRIQNGAILFSGALSVYGIHRPGQLLHREDPAFVLPFNIEDANLNWPPVDRTRFLVFGGYAFDGSSVCIDRTGGQICLFRRGRQTLLSEPAYSWSSLEEWIVSEIARLAMLFDSRGQRLVDEAQTVPIINAAS
jgi:hypothetical protein